MQLRGRVAVPGEYMLVVEYASEEEDPQTLSVSVNSPRGRNKQQHVKLLHCKYRSVYVSECVDTSCNELGDSIRV